MAETRSSHGFRPLRFLLGSDAQRKRGHAAAGSGAERQLAVLLGDVSRESAHALGVQERDSEFSDAARIEADAPRHAAEEGEERRLP